MPELLLESVAEAPVKVGKRWRVVIARPGKGTSGNYAAEMLKEYGPAALAPHAKAFFDHDPSRSIKDMVGTYPDGAYWDADQKELVAELQPFKHWQDVIDEIGPHAEASIYMMGEKDDAGNVTKLIPHRTNGADLVGYGGLEGSGLKEQVESLLESARALDSGEKPSTRPVQENRDTIMVDEKEFKEFRTLVESFIATSTEKSKGEAQASVDAAALAESNEKAVEAYDAAVTLIEAATELLPSQRASLREAAKGGADVAPLIEQAKKVVDEFKAHALTESGDGRSFGGAVVEDWTVAGVRV